MATRNDITGDVIASKTNSDAFRDGWERIFAKKTEQVQQKESNQNETSADTPANAGSIDG